MPRQGLCAEVNISATRVTFSAGEVVTLISTGLRYPGLAGQLTLQHVACDNQHRVAQQVWRIAAEVAQSCDDDRLHLGDAQWLLMAASQ